MNIFLYSSALQQWCGRVKKYIHYAAEFGVSVHVMFRAWSCLRIKVGGED